MADVYYICFLGILYATGFSHKDNFFSFANAEVHPAPDFSRHTLIKPRIYHGREKRQITTTQQEDGNHVHHVSISYNLDDKEYILDLQLNSDLIPKGYFRRFQENGGHVVHKPTKEETNFCHYYGKIRDVSNSWVALSTCDEYGISGVIYDGKEMHYIQNHFNTTDNENSLLFYKHSDLVSNNKTCGYVGDGGHSTNGNHEFNRILRYKRAAESSRYVKGPYNANRQSRYVELVLVVDNLEYKEMRENIPRIDHHCKIIANIINGLYAPLNIFVALVGVVIWSERDEISFSANGDTTLTNFLHYRRETLMKEHPNDNAQLLTKFVFEHGVVGKALKGPICTIEYSGGVNTDHSTIIGLVATTVAHEMGHNFGMEHDTNECSCPDERCIMAPSSSSTPPSHWSSCSLEHLAFAFEHGMDYCLQNKPEALFASPVCGNGFVEPGEQCDCGLPEHCDNNCCNATTCMLYGNATCATGECCDLQSCRPKNAGTLCRSADYECDLPEYCTGESEYCPADVYKMDTTPCNSEKAYCYAGSCRTHNEQCKLLWGETGKSSDDECYLLNTKGTRHGNCGYNKLNQQTYNKCNDEDVFCGMLHCKHLNERLEFGMDSVAILSQSFINVKGSVVPCRTALVDLGINPIDPGLVPDGAKCGDSKMCVNQKCMSLPVLRNSLSCLDDCNGNGFCNNLRHCHCKDGFAPPFCDYPGFGGSEDSGPTIDPDEGKEFTTAMFIIFLGIIPALAIFGFLMYYIKHNLKLAWKKPSGSHKTSPKSRSPSSFPPSTTPKRTEDNHSLLADTKVLPGFKNEFFGNFKGFSITPLKLQESEPVRPAPPVPTLHKTINKSTSNTNASAKVNFLLNKPPEKPQPTEVVNPSSDQKKIVAPPALPPLNPGSHPRPIISSPILENSTCTAKELVSPLKHVPNKIVLRPAPSVPNVDVKRPLSSPTSIIISPIVEEEPKPNNNALNRIASFLKSDKKQQHNNTLPKKPKIKAIKALDKNALRTIEISNPIPQAEIIIPTLDVSVDAPEIDTKAAVVKRAQSMRVANNLVQRPNIPNFGSMRQPSGFKRPVSIPAATRPKSPPPPRPPVINEIQGGIKIPTIPGYQKPSGPEASSNHNQYDDCLNEAPKREINKGKLNVVITDNIYAVIDETPTPNEVGEIPKRPSENAGLLGEIVSEIQNRNGESIYSTSTLNKKSPNQNEEVEIHDDSSEIYVNTCKVPPGIYSNMNNIKSSASSTSSGYITPTSVNTPLKSPPIESKTPPSVKIPSKPSPQKAESKPLVNTTKPQLAMSTFATTKNVSKPLLERKPETLTTFKGSGKSLNENQIKDGVKTAKASPISKPSPKPLNKQVTPPFLRAKRPSPVRTHPTVNKTTSNSPDLVTSCSNSLDNNVKSPDVLNSGVTMFRKPSLPKTVPKTSKVLKSQSVKESMINNCDLGFSNKSADGGAALKASVARHNSNVAALQQKFENKNSKLIAVKNK